MIEGRTTELKRVYTDDIKRFRLGAAILNTIKETGGDRYEDARSINQQLTFEEAERYFARRGLPFGEQRKRRIAE